MTPLTTFNTQQHQIHLRNKRKVIQKNIKEKRNQRREEFQFVCNKKNKKMKKK